MKRTAAVLASLLAAAPAAAQTVIRARRAPLLGAVQPFRGEVNAYHPYRVTAPYDGRVESILVAPNQWVVKSDVLALIATAELAAMIDSSATTPQDVLEKRWQNVFKPTEMHCPFEGCVVLSVTGTSHQRMSTGDLILVLAEAYTLEAEVRPPASQNIIAGQVVEVWSPSDPKKRLPARVLDVRGQRSSGQVHASLLLPQNLERIKPGDILEGEIPLNKREPLLLVPAGALTTFQGRSFVNVEVQTGLNNGRDVEVLSGLDETRNILLPAGISYEAPSSRPSTPPRKQDEDEE